MVSWRPVTTAADAAPNATTPIPAPAPPRRDGQRAQPMCADDRRAAIVEATLPLLRTYGRSVTTRQIAEAAEIAEGTIFRVFDDKDELIDAAVARAFDPAQAVAALRRIDPEGTLDERVTAAADVIRDRLVDIFELMNVLGGVQPPARGPGDRPDLAHVAALFEPDRAILSVEPRTAAQLLWGLTLAANHPASPFDARQTPAQVALVLLDGIRCADPAVAPAAAEADATPIDTTTPPPHAPTPAPHAPTPAPHTPKPHTPTTRRPTEPRTRC